MLFLEIFNVQNNLFLPVIKFLRLCLSNISYLVDCLSLLFRDLLKCLQHLFCFKYFPGLIKFVLNFVNHEIILLKFLWLDLFIVGLIFFWGNDQYSEILQLFLEVLLYWKVVVVQSGSSVIDVEIFHFHDVDVGVNDNTNHEIEHNEWHEEDLNDEQRIHNEQLQIDHILLFRF